LKWGAGEWVGARPGVEGTDTCALVGADPTLFCLASTFSPRQPHPLVGGAESGHRALWRTRSDHPGVGWGRTVSGAARRTGRRGVGKYITCAGGGAC